MDVAIREFEKEDYPELVRVTNAVLPDHAETVEEVRHWDEHKDPKCKQRRWVASVGTDIVGIGQYDQNPWGYHPRKFWISVGVMGEHRRRGVGKALLDAVTDGLREHDPLLVRTSTRADLADGMRFAAANGFKEDRRQWESVLDVAKFDPSPFAGAAERVASQRIEIRTVAELMHSDPDWQRKLHDVGNVAGLDVPRSDDYTPVSFEFFRDVLLKDPSFLPDGFFVAVDDGKYVGLTNLWSRKADDTLNTGFTGILPEYRKRGIALALKLRALDYAKRKGAPRVRTGNDSTNRPMLAINEALGFVKNPAWVNFVKVLKEE